MLTNLEIRHVCWELRHLFAGQNSELMHQLQPSAPDIVAAVAGKGLNFPAFVWALRHV